jgi:hypothetical protein
MAMSAGREKGPAGFRLVDEGWDRELTAAHRADTGTPIRAVLIGNRLP